MANKVLTIKMDEKDIEKIKKCYKAFVDAGFLSAQTMSLNAFYKHLLLDYLEFDISNAFDMFSDYGLEPKCLDPNELDGNKSILLTNTYNFDAESFESYKKCVKEALSKNINMMKENAKVFNELVKAGVMLTDGRMRTMEYIYIEDVDEQVKIFWKKKVIEAMNLNEKEYRDNGIDGDIDMIKESSISDAQKEKLISLIKEYEKNRKQNYNITKGRGIVK